MSANDNATTLAQHVIVATLGPFVGSKPAEAGLILARAAKELGVTYEVERAMALIRHTHANCQDCGARQSTEALITKGDHHGGWKRVCADRGWCHGKSLTDAHRGTK